MITVIGVAECDNLLRTTMAICSRIIHTILTTAYNTSEEKIRVLTINLSYTYFVQIPTLP